jgi:hypothetical protein
MKLSYDPYNGVDTSRLAFASRSRHCVDRVGYLEKEGNSKAKAEMRYYFELKSSTM